MIKKYNPEQTKKNIIETAVRLFTEKGFDKTSMQDIANTLGVSKGGIYHHFRSKKEIINTVRENKANQVQENVKRWTENIDASSEQKKLTAVLEKNITDREAHDFDEVFRSQIKSSDFIVSMMKNAIDSSAPVFAEIMKKGKEDGSITTNYPDEAAEVFFLLMNIWCDPAVFHADEEKLEKRLKFVQEMMRRIGVDIVSTQVVNETLALLKNLYFTEEVKKDDS